MRDDNRARVFLALKFLRDRLRLKARLEDRNFTFRIVRGGAPLKDLAHDMVADMPTLTGITGNALFALFTTMIWSYRVFRHVSQRWTGGEPPESIMFCMTGELSQLDIEVTERLHRKAVEKETGIREEAAKSRRALVASTSAMKDSHDRTRKALRSSQTYVVAYQGTSQCSGTSSTHRERPFRDEDDEDCESQMDHDPNNVLDDVSSNDSTSLTFNWRSSMVHDMTPAEFLIAESDCDDASSRASTPLLSPLPPPLRVFSVETSISELEAKLEQMAKKFAGAISGINGRLDEVSKGLIGENGVSLMSQQYGTQKDLERLEKKLDAFMEFVTPALRRISPGADVGSHDHISHTSHTHLHTLTPLTPNLIYH
ncbi:hypothetical protein EC957_000590 [Mortierella hygrophila]|uniref:Uncharacterized protein n=1 Tax=Mortierella hygrophila TaxID=979708 RepID=A0A9P6K2Z1_9FUNG|nr:hypothetical protein EC957_000590 [Mortierella hygrophila]